MRSKPSPLIASSLLSTRPSFRSRCLDKSSWRSRPSASSFSAPICASSGARRSLSSSLPMIPSAAKSMSPSRRFSSSCRRARTAFKRLVSSPAVWVLRKRFRASPKRLGSNTVSLRTSHTFSSVFEARKASYPGTPMKRSAFTSRPVKYLLRETRLPSERRG